VNTRTELTVAVTQHGMYQICHGASFQVAEDYSIALT